MTVRRKYWRGQWIDFEAMREINRAEEGSRPKVKAATVAKVRKRITSSASQRSGMTMDERGFFFVWGDVT